MSRTSPSAARAPHASSAHGKPHTIRIIGGDWKRTPLPVLDLDGLRPTPDRVRETVFNWLGQRLDGQRCDLTSHQFDLLVVLARSPGRVLSRDQIMDALKGHPLEAFDRSIDVHISRIRSVIEEDPKNPKRVLTVRGSGYLFARKQDA